ncbi:long-chain fatty acid--CoA ligase [Gammaproteobacteria bacterium 42_54_T18]|nr:long-chain fatty acid--CoA ligase [Gammaproteobacteria bacterium 42_54_T18]
MLSTMMEPALTITSVMNFAKKNYPNQEIISVTADNPLHRYTYKDAFQRVGKLANALVELGAKPGDVIGTMAWNDYRHLELYYGISCSGMVCHTINPRLFDEQIEYIVEHAEDKFLFVDPLFVTKIEALQDKMPNVLGFIVLTSEDNMPETTLRNVHCYETLIADKSDEFVWPELQESAASALCYTSGTTGNPKGVVYSHRSTVLHSYASSMPDAFAFSRNDVVMPIVPMFHVNGWGIVYSAPMAGAKLVMPGPKMADGKVLTTLINQEKITMSAGVPTVWLALLDYLEQSGESIDSLKRVTVGGAACPLPIFKTFYDKYGVEAEHAWGMTEMSPLGTYNKMSSQDRELPEEEFNQKLLRQGRPIYGVDLRIVNENGDELPWDGTSSGAVQVRGAFVTAGYHKQQADFTPGGWFETGDVAFMDEESRMQITDRTKDIIKSGGEWISSIELENLAMSHPAVAEAAVIGVAHEKWTERPLLVVVRKPDSGLTAQDILKFYQGKVATWWIPTEVAFVVELAHTATGKLDKKTIRQWYQDYQWQD